MFLSVVDGTVMGGSARPIFNMRRRSGESAMCKFNYAMDPPLGVSARANIGREGLGISGLFSAVILSLGPSAVNYGRGTDIARNSAIFGKPGTARFAGGENGIVGRATRTTGWPGVWERTAFCGSRRGAFAATQRPRRNPSAGICTPWAHPGACPPGKWSPRW